jgi:hypothetical protein
VQGWAAVHHLNGWTALAWWDRTGDQRHGSNAALFAKGTHTLEQMLVIGRRNFPRLFRRFTYTITTERL